MAIYYESTLQHHGVKGMRWGVRRARPKSGYVTVRQAYKNARENEIDARKQEIQNSKGKGMTARRAIKNAKKAGEAARWQSIQDDKAYNRELRGQQASKTFLQKHGTKLAAAAIIVGAVVGKKLVGSYLQSRGMNTSSKFRTRSNSYNFAPNFTRFGGQSRASTMPIPFNRN